MTIYALSSGSGISGIAVIRISGLETREIITKMTSGSFPAAKQATLKKISKDPKYLDGGNVKISRSAVKFVITTTTLLSKTNFGLRALFYLLSIQMPKARKLITAISSEKK